MIYDNIGGDKGNVNEVEVEGVLQNPGAGENDKLADDTADIADDNQVFKNNAFAEGRAAFQGLWNVKGPGAAEDNEHENLEQNNNIHLSISFL